jgi:asparagine N-glycosylation enzyme membrane subunit Stt3
MNFQGVKEKSKNVFQFLKKKKILIIIAIVLLAVIIGITSHIRMSNISTLKDATTGEYLTADLDAFYWLRLATILDTNGSYPAYDVMRYPTLKLPFSNELLPRALVFMHKTLSPIWSNMTLRYVDVIYPVIFFALGMIIFFFLILKLTKSKVAALLSSFFLAIIPAYLFRTMGGVSDHEPLGMFAFYLALLSFAISIDIIERKKSNWKGAILLGIITGFFTVFNIAAWSGVSLFTLLIIPLTIFILWITHKKNEGEKSNFKEYLLFYTFWIFSYPSLAFIFSYPTKVILASMLGITGIIVPLVFIFIIIDYILMHLKITKLKEIGKYRIIVSLVLTILFLAIMSIIFKHNIGLSNIISSILRPFGGGRTGSTVAENALPYTVDIISQIGKVLFWLFFVGALIVGIDFSKGIGKKKNKILFSFLWVLMIFAIIFHRYSTTAGILNGDSFISKFFYIGSIFVFAVAFIWIYFKDNLETKSENIIILLLTFFLALAGVSAIRLLFVFTFVICFVSAYAVIKIYEYAKNSKEEIIKMILYIALIAIVILLIFSSITYIKTIKAQSAQIGSSANTQWQYSMKWVRDNTQPGDIFVHWWDYGYWVQYIGERPTVTDGGHGDGYWDHLTGRYLLTTPYPDTALSFMKAQNVSYLLIDPTDIGKYSAFSSIGSDNSGTDRYSFIPSMISNPSQTQETKNGTVRIYNGGFGLDEDIIYKQQGQPDVFLPMQSAGLGGIILEEDNNTFKQPQAAYVYNGNQINLPVRYIYYNGTLYDFKNGTNSAIYIIPQITQVSTGIQIDEEGALIYLSPKVVDSLFAQLYLMNDSSREYKGAVTLAHSEPDPLGTYIEMYSGKKLNEFFYFNGIRGPLDIWKVTPPANIIARPEFLMPSGTYAGLDNLTFVK